MKSKRIRMPLAVVTATLAVSGFAVLSVAQPAPPATATPPQPAGLPLVAAPAPPPNVQATPPAQAQAQGTVLQYLMNPQGQVDGLLLADGTQVNFPPHMSDTLTGTVKTNDPVTVQGMREAGTVVTASTITDARTSQTATALAPTGREQPLPPMLQGAGLKPMTASGKIKTVLHAPRGEVEGAVLDNGQIIHLGSEAGSQFTSLLGVGQPITAKGYGTANAYGQSLQATEIGASGQSLTPVYGAPARPPGP